MITNLSRRNVLKLSLGGAAGLLATTTGLASAETPRQTEGPFHPMGGGVDRRILDGLDQDADLTFVNDRPEGTAYGDVVYVYGVVRDESGNPIQGALLEAWQACVSGKYNHRADPGTDWLDPYFQYWGRATTNSSGFYYFRTIVPGAYQASPGWIRPPHIHFKISRRGYNELTTQMYFSGVRFYYGGRFYEGDILDRLNRADGVLSGVPASQQSEVIAIAREPGAGAGVDPDSKLCRFNIELRRTTGSGSSDPGIAALLSG